MFRIRLKNIIIKKLDYIIGVSISIFVLIFYILTLSPTVNFIDSGELATVAYTLGIAHPTGYPLFTLIANVFSHLPLGLRVIQQLNLLSAIFCSIGLFFFFRFLLIFLKESSSSYRETSNIEINFGDKKYLIQIVLPAIFGTMILGFSETYWSQAVSIEVYSLHVLFLTMILYLFIKAIFTYDDLRLKNSYLLNFSFVLGLSFTNHMTTILLAPAIIYLFFYTYGFNRNAMKKIVWLVMTFTLGFSVYLYLPFRSSQSPIMNWGNPIDFEKWFWHFSGKVYRVWIFSSTESAARQFTYFINMLPAEFCYFPLVFAFVGVVSLFKKRRELFIYTLLLFVTCVLYSINYDIHDIDSYFLLAYITIAIWSAVGVYQIISFFKSNFKIIILSITMGVIASVVIYNYSRVDESKNYIVEDYTKDLMNSIEPNGLIISYQWDYFVSPVYFLQLVEKYRPDVVVVDKELLRRSWYYVQLQSRYPWLTESIKKEINAFLIELKKFEHDEPYNSQVIEYFYGRLINSIIKNNYAQRAIYVTPEIEYQYTYGFERIPKGLVFQLVKNIDTLKPHSIEFKYHYPEKRTKYVEGILSLYAKAYYNNAMYYNIIGEKNKAIEYLKDVIRVHPELEDYIISYEKLLK